MTKKIFCVVESTRRESTARVTMQSVWPDRLSHWRICLPFQFTAGATYIGCIPVEKSYV